MCSILRLIRTCRATVTWWSRQIQQLPKIWTAQPCDQSRKIVKIPAVLLRMMWNWASTVSLHHAMQQFSNQFNRLICIQPQCRSQHIANQVQMAMVICRKCLETMTHRCYWTIITINPCKIRISIHRLNCRQRHSQTEYGTLLSIWLTLVQWMESCRKITLPVSNKQQAFSLFVWVWFSWWRFTYTYIYFTQWIHQQQKTQITIHMNHDHWQTGGSFLSGNSGCDCVLNYSPKFPY